MNSEDRFWLGLWTVVALTVVTLTIGCYGIRAAHVEKMAKLGYEERQCIGSCETIWVHVGDRL